MGGKDQGWHLAGMGLAWLLGVALQLQERALLPLWAYLSCLAAGLLCCAVAWRWSRWWGLSLIAMVLVGAGAAGWRASERLADGLSVALEGKDLQVIGVVAGLPQQSAVGLKFRFQIEEARYEGRPVTVPSLVALGWYVGW